MLNDESEGRRKLAELDRVLERARGSPDPEPGDHAGVQALHSAWLRAIAIVWTDPAKLDLLKRDPREFFRTRCGYDPPAHLAFTIVEARDVGGSWAWDARSLPEAEVTLLVPPPPELDEQPIALADLASAVAMVPVCCC